MRPCTRILYLGTTDLYRDAVMFVLFQVEPLAILTYYTSRQDGTDYFSSSIGVSKYIALNGKKYR